MRRLGVGLEGYGAAGARSLRAARLDTLLVRARGRDAEAVAARLATLGDLARHATATVLLDIDEDWPVRLGEPWSTVACRPDPELCGAP
ncbi:MAG: hypothetical protein M5U28_40960 [Sandaracinaceae bacterium]|nr:hypothetical protein [Sandaracinaceae bacterium]